MIDEIRMTNDESNPNVQMTNDRNARSSRFSVSRRPRFSHSSFSHSVIDSSFVIRHSNFRRAFTLLEVVLALALTVIVSTIVASAMYTAVQIKRSVNSALDIARSNDVAADVMAQEIANALPQTQPLNAGVTVQLPGASASNGNLIGPFVASGDPTADSLLDFFTTGPEPKADLQPDVREVQYALVDGPNGTKNLVRRVTTNLLPIDTTTLPPDIVLAQNVVNVTFSFYDGATTYDSWDSTQVNYALPLTVEFTIELAPQVPGQPNRITTRTISLACGTDASTTSATGGTTP